MTPRTTPIYFLLLALLLLVGCAESDNTLTQGTFEYDDISASAKIKRSLDPNYLEKLGISSDDQRYLNNFYAQRNFAPLWINDSTLSELGIQMKIIFKQPEQLGVPTNRYPRHKTRNFVQDELATTLLFAQLVNDLETGVVDFTAKTANGRSVAKKRPLATVSESRLGDLANMDPTQDVRHQFLNIGTQDSTYQVLGKGLLTLIDTYPMDATTFAIKSERIDSTKSTRMATAALISKGYLEKGKDSTAMLEALKEFQLQNGLNSDGVVGKYTAIALNESTAHRRDRIILAMDKLRTRRAFPNKYIHINIPEYVLRFYINDSLKSRHNVVVGRHENQTPELTSKLTKIIAFPYWSVPYSISSKEILPAAQANAGYFARHQYKIYKKDIEIDPLTVNWKAIKETSFSYRVVQEPGKTNSLGIMKFDFPNTHSVYFHDTPSKSLFSADVRAYSHGCMRTQHPVELAKAILERDDIRETADIMIVDSLDSIMARGKNYTIRLQNPIPVYIEYNTVTREGERMVCHIDIYGRDEEYLKIMHD